MNTEGTTNQQNQNNENDETERIEAYKSMVDAYKNMVDAYKKSTSDLRWGIAILIPLFMAFLGYLLFVDKQNYKEAVEKAEIALKNTQTASEKTRIVLAETRAVAEEAQTTLTEIQKEAIKINQINSRAEELLKNAETKISQKLDEAFDKIFKIIDKKVRDKLKETEKKGESLLSQIQNKGRDRLDEITAKGEKLFLSTDLWHKGRRAMDEKKYKEAVGYWEEAVSNDPNNRETLHNLGVSWAGLAREHDGKYSDTYFKRAYKRFEDAYSIDPNRAIKTLTVWGNELAAQAVKKNNEETDGLFDEAYKKYEKALGIDKTYYDALTSWARSLVEQAKMKQGNEADKLFDEARSKFKNAIHSEPNEAQHLFYMGKALYEYVGHKEGQAEIDTLEESKKKLKEALDIDPRYYDALNTLGRVCQNLACLYKGRDSSDSIIEAKKAYLKAFSIDPDRSEALHGLGLLFTDLASTNTNIKQRSWLTDEASEKYEWAFHRSNDPIYLREWGTAFKQKSLNVKELDERLECLWKAVQKYDMATEFNPRDERLLSERVTWLLEIARHVKKETRQKLLEDAEEKCSLIESIGKGKGAFLSACVKALKGNEEACRLCLECGQEMRTLPTFKEAMSLGQVKWGFVKIKSGYLGSMKNKKWFKKIKWKEEKTS